MFFEVYDFFDLTGKTQMASFKATLNLVFEGRAWAFRKTVQTKTVIIGFLRF
jgi:hypothetical protein